MAGLKEVFAPGAWPEHLEDQDRYLVKLARIFLSMTIVGSLDQKMASMCACPRRVVTFTVCVFYYKREARMQVYMYH
jgi:hypothetical protein